MGSEAPGSRKTAREEKDGCEGIWKAYLLGSGLINCIIMGRPETTTAKRDMSVVKRSKSPCALPTFVEARIDKEERYLLEGNKQTIIHGEVCYWSRSGFQMKCCENVYGVPYLVGINATQPRSKEYHNGPIGNWEITDFQDVNNLFAKLIYGNFTGRPPFV
jgi:hypothetical protein